MNEQLNLKDEEILKLQSMLFKQIDHYLSDEFYENQLYHYLNKNMREANARNSNEMQYIANSLGTANDIVTKRENLKRITKLDFNDPKIHRILEGLLAI